MDLMRAHRVLVLALLATLVAPSAGTLATDPGPADLPVPRAGDTGTYTLVDPLPPGATVQEGDEEALIRFAVGAPQLRTDAYGHQREVVPITFDPSPEAAPSRPQQRAWQPWTTWLTHRGTGPVMTDRPAPPSQGFSFTAGPLGDGDDRGPRASGQLRYAHAGQALDGPACWLAAGPHTGTLDEGLASSFAPCGRDLAMAAATNGTRLAIRAGPVQPLADGTRQVTVHLTVEEPALTAHLTLTYRSGLPVPVRIALDAQHAPGVPDPDALGFVWRELIAPIDVLARGPDPGPVQPGMRGEPVDATLELTRFARGDGARLPDGEPIRWPDARESLHRAPLTRWGPKDGGETFDLTRAEAAGALQADPTLSIFHTWLADHPGARAILTSHQILDDGGGEAWSFWFVAPDRTAWGLRSERRLATGIDAAREPIEQATLVNSAEQMQRFPPCPDGCTFDVTPAIDRVPTIRSAIEVWQREASLTAATSTPSAYVWVQSPWFGEMRIAAGWGPAADAALPVEMPTAQSPAPGRNATAILLSPHDGALTERQGLDARHHVAALPASATVDPARPAEPARPLATLATVAAAIAVLGVISAAHVRRDR